jgi:pyridoxine 4-dehydrogenase
MRITGPGIWGDPKNPKEAQAVLRRAVELGVNFIDTADSYGPEVSENMIAQTLHPYPKGLIIATKGGLTRQGPDKWAPVGRPEYLIQCVEMSLRRLKLDCIDLYQLHRIDPLVPVEDSLGALKEMQKEGKIRYIGLSEVSIPDIERAKKIVKVVSIQNLYNLSNRQAENVVQYCEMNELAFIPWFPIASGELVQHPGGGLERLAKLKDATEAQIALAWLLKRSPVMIPIPGTSSVAHLEENICAASLELTDDEFALLKSMG